MKKNFLSLFLGLFIFQLQAQNYLKIYHPLINQAELSVVEANYTHAFTYYKRAFDTVKVGFTRDYYNAALCAAMLGDVSVTYDMLQKVAAKGISLDFVKGEPWFEGIQKDTQWRDFEKEYLELKRTFDANIQQDVKRKMEILVMLDKKFRKDPYTAQARADSIQMIDAGNAQILKDMIEKKGFPDETMLGHSEGGFPSIQPAFYQLIRRQTPDNQTFNFSNLVLTAMQEGKIQPQLGANLLASLNGIDSFFIRHVFRIICDNAENCKNISNQHLLNKWVRRTLTIEEEKEFEQVRLQNGMESMTDYRRKIKFSLQDEHFLFPYKALASTWFLENPDEANSALEHTEELK